MNISSPKHFQSEFSKSQVSPHQSLPYSVHCHLWLSLKVLGDLVPAYLPISPLTVPPFHPGHSHHSRLCFLPGPVSAFWAFPRAGPFTWNFSPTLISFPNTFSFQTHLRNYLLWEASPVGNRSVSYLLPWNPALTSIAALGTLYCHYAFMYLFLVTPWTAWEQG